MGIGVGVGLLIAPASGEETRADVPDKISDFGDKVRKRTGKKAQAATGTHDELGWGWWAGRLNVPLREAEKYVKLLSEMGGA